MEKEYLLKLKKKLSQLNKEEEKQRDIYLRKLATGELQGPLTGYSSIDKTWLKWYEEEKMNVEVPNMTVYGNFLELTEKFGDDHVLLSFYGKKYTREDIRLEVNKHMNLLRNKMNLKSGDTISLMMLDVPEVLFIWFAANELGIICNMLKFDESPEKIKEKMDLTGSKILFVTEFAPMLENAIKGTKELNNFEKLIPIEMNNALNEEQMKAFLNEELEVSVRTVKNYSSEDRVKVYEKIKELCKLAIQQKKSEKIIKRLYELTDKIEIYKELMLNISTEECDYKKENNPKDLVSVVVYTGGTTGPSKGVQLTNKNLNAMVYGVTYGDGEFNENQTSMNILPPGIAFYYNGVLSFMCQGINVDLISHFNEQTYPFIVNYHKPNVLVGGPILMEKTRKSNAIKDGSYIQISASGGDKLSIEEELLYNDYLKEHGSDTNIHQGWGMSECAAVASYATTKSYKPGSIGIPLINFEIGVFEYGTDIEVPTGMVGELCVSSDSVMKGYLGNEIATNMIIKKHSDGKLWLHSDDLGCMDEDGRIYHKGRVKRMLTRAGSKVWLSEIENIISTNPFVDKCCCVKLDDVDEREVPVVHIVLKEDNLSLTDLILELDKIITNSLGEVSIPKYYVFRKEFPYTNVNKKVDYMSLEKEEIFGYEIDGRIIKVKAKELTIKKN